ncbi:hypothetical protein [Baia soyae]|uniref:Uncharacterized protein n=1 Tax=Baia soyae TaxID=1544746 RepID=A0A4R2RUX9_9BACL|nr:hypothetical protein [Baia soyae]TCP63741.1 hypothetical protein EDD57_14715 [Baia soyae]
MTYRKWAVGFLSTAMVTSVSKEDTSTSSRNKKKIPAGEYLLSVDYEIEKDPESGFFVHPSELDVSYMYKINGILMDEVDNTIPELQTKAPTKDLPTTKHGL